MIRAFFFLLLLPSLLLASKILDYSVHKYPDRIDVLIVFDKPYHGELRKKQQSKEFVFDKAYDGELSRELLITLSNATIASKKTKSVASPLFSKLTLVPDKKQTKIIANIAKSVTMQAAKSSDKRQLRLRFSKLKQTLSTPVDAALAKKEGLTKKATPVKKAVPAQKTVSSKKIAPAKVSSKKTVPSKKEVSSKPDETVDEESSGNYYYIFPVVLIILLITALFLKRQGSVSASDEEGSSENIDHVSINFQKILNPDSKLLMLAVGVAMSMLLIPKINLYYQFEKLVEPYGIVLSDEKLYKDIHRLTIRDATLYVKQIESAKAEKIRVYLFLLYNRIDIENIRLSSTFKQFVPTGVERMRIQYSVLDPLRITVKAVGDFGTAEGKLVLRERLFKMTLQPSTIMKKRYKSTLNKLTKEEAGGFSYESRF